jgi:hypothetical protein
MSSLNRCGINRRNLEGEFIQMPKNANNDLSTKSYLKIVFISFLAILLTLILIALLNLFPHIVNRIVNQKLKKFCFVDEMYSEEFFIDLSSNTLDYPENKVANFKNNIPLIKKLTGNWEVALVSINFTKSWRNLRATSQLCVENESYILDNENFPFKSDETENLPDYRCGILQAGYYKSIEELLDEIKQEYTAIKDVRIAIMPTFKFNNITQIVRIKPGKDIHGDNLLPRLSNELQDILGFENYSTISPIYNDFNEIVASRPADMNAGLHALYIYCDIIEPQYVGNIRDRLLKIVPVPSDKKFGQLCSKTYDDPHFVNVLINDFEHIEIDIKDDTNTRFPFIIGRSNLKLKFRKRNE